jgi:RES domain-containing protein
MVLWRICRSVRTKNAFDGEGARKNPGRWNQKDIPIVYCASSLSLAALEYFVHVDSDELPDDLMAIRAELPDDVGVERVDGARLPKGWRQAPGPALLQDIGTEWAGSLRTAALLVPSAIMPVENNILLNPRHADMARLSQGVPEPFVFDPRMRK